MFAVFEGLEAVGHRSNRIARAFDHHIDMRVAHDGLPIVCDPGLTAFERMVHAAGLCLLRPPAHTLEVGAGGVGREIGDGQQMHAGRPWHLGQVHGAELTGTNQHDANGLAGSGTLLQFGVEIHQAAFLLLSIGSVEVTRALPGMPFFQGRSTG